MRRQVTKYFSMSHKITTHWKGGMQFESDNPSGQTILMDTAVEGTNQRHGVSPKAMMLSALAGCSGIDIVEILSKMRVTDYRLQMDVEGKLTDQHPKYYHKVRVDYHFYGDDLDAKKIQKAVELSIDKYCGVMEMFRKFAAVETHIHLH